MNQKLRQFKKRLQPYMPTLRLSGSYLAVIMVMSIGFSTILYHTSVQEIGRQLPPQQFYEQTTDDTYDIFNTFFQKRIDRGKHEILARLVLINLIVLLGGAAVSYILARRTLEPIEVAMESQRRFASDASHELRTPLATIQTENEIALRSKNLSLARSKELLASNLEEVQRLQALSDGLLRLARQDETQLELGPVLVSDCVSEATHALQKAADGKSIKIESKVGNTVALANDNALSQILSILIDNAIKYSPPKTTVRITSNIKNNEVKITVADEGPGIIAADIPHIFERFYRADQSRTKQTVTGHGLGLALARQLIEQLDGQITVQSKPTKGTKFTIHLSRP